jgi:anti-anti-sigma factor
VSAVDLPDVTTADLRVTAEHDGGAITIHFSGTADMRVSDALDQVLARLHEHTLRLSAPRVIVDLRELEFMNSSCLKSFVTWISNVRELDPEKQYAIHFISRPEILWQRRSLHALRCFAVDLITVES